MSLTDTLQTDMNDLVIYLNKRTEQLEAEYWAALKDTTPEFELQERAKNEYKRNKIYTETELAICCDNKER